MNRPKSKMRGGKAGTVRSEPEPKPLQPESPKGEIAVDPKEKLVPIPDTERKILPGARQVADANPEEQVHVTIYVRPKSSSLAAEAYQQATELPPQMRKYATPQQMKDLFGADEGDMDKVEQWAKAQGLQVDERNAGARSLKVTGTVADMGRAFGVHLAIHEHPTGRYRGRTGPVCIAKELSGIVEAVFGLDNRRIGQAYLRRIRPVPSVTRVQQKPFAAPQLASIYNFPPGDGSGQCIGILVFNGQVGETGQTAQGGYDPASVKKYFDALNIPMPDIQNVVVHGPGNQPGDGSGNDVTGEVLLDIQVAGTLAPAAKIVMYFTEFTEQGWVDAITAAVTDTTHNPSVLSISYGNPEDADQVSLWTRAAISKVDNAFRQAALKGLTICCASGDDGSSDQVQDGLAHVDFPSSSPSVLGCGGTRVTVTQSAIQETVWNDGPGSAGGGGVSTLFPLPSYQTGVNPPRSANPGHRIGRVVPDVSGLADPETGLIIVGPSGDFEGPIGGTSATAPMWAALVARLNQALGTPVGFLNSILYKFMASGVLRDVVTGNNGVYSANPGFDACTGLGTPDGVKLLAALQALGGPGTHVMNGPSQAIPRQQATQAAPAAAGASDVPSDISERLRDIERRLATDALERQAIMSTLASIVGALQGRPMA
jgi:kumamolisin